ncbi:hypothetical protein XO10_00925 [Marinitoga sp. 1135]|uniref:PEGA domain-containing protein n=1 Tax=Marinitoga piezophila (strain DSM 14283 / JCM 11233 / KA3) TaxID=443254 RepID=H2J365_MARPK|nr:MULTISPECIES: PEGA domain-containing protein [Marinitoga]AEX84583.1 PEGA domain-containing protein [Marinitoga piezophila KA3]APT75103.1 hypothetical protein LN42_00865 [Marinitoga sp. 1137]NUU94876.1 hypothetical protein [Marinitoga sp. 1135]NUU96814.1 hypothetical protein [Marinitoga sp. 1138]
MKKNKIFLLLFFIVFSILSFSYQLKIFAPKGALIYIDGQYIKAVKNTFESIDISSGTHTVTIKKFGYEDYIKTMDISSDTELRVSLIPLASLKIISNIEQFYVQYNNKKFLVNNHDTITVPVNIKDFYFTFDNYKPQKLQIDLKPFETRELYLTFIPEGMIKITSNPTSILYINNVKIGETPYSTVLNKGVNYKLKFERKDYITIEKNINITEKVKDISVQLKKGINLYVDSSPRNALVVINNKKYGYTPGNFVVPEGTLNIVVSKIGYISKRLTINLDKKTKSKQLFFELYENSRTVFFKDVKNLEFYLDGKYIGKEVEELELDGMPHIIEIVSKNDKNLFFRYIIHKDDPKQIVLNPKLYTSIEVLSSIDKVLTYIGDKFAFTPSTILIDTMQETKKIDIYYLNAKKMTTIRKNRSQTVFLTEDKNVGALSLFTTSSRALIYIDGNYENTGYLIGKVLKTGTHNITFKFPDGNIYNIDVSISQYNHKVVFFSRANLVPVKIYNRKGYDLFVDDVKYTGSEVNLRLEYGVHKIALYKGNLKIKEKYIYFTDEGKFINVDNWY